MKTVLILRLNLIQNLIIIFYWNLWSKIYIKLLLGCVKNWKSGIWFKRKCINLPNSAKCAILQRFHELLCNHFRKKEFLKNVSFKTDYSKYPFSLTFLVLASLLCIRRLNQQSIWPIIIAAWFTLPQKSKI